MAALFAPNGGRAQSKHLVEFRAGKMNLKGKTVHADTRKGLAYLYQSDDALMHFCWKERQKPSPEDDLIIFPDDCEFKHVPQCTTGRCYLLKFKSTNKKHFFWMQEPRAEKDIENVKKVNEYLNNPPTPTSSSSTSAGRLGGGGLGEHDLQSLLGGMGGIDHQQLMQLFGGAQGLSGLSSFLSGRPGSAQSETAPPSRAQSSPGQRTSMLAGSPTTPFGPPLVNRPVTAAATVSTTAPTTTAPVSVTSSQAAIQLSDLQNILSGLDGAGGAAGGRSGNEGIDLSTAITPEAMVPILANKEIQERLIPFLPEGDTLPKTEEELRKTISSPQFQQAMGVFSAALASGQLGPLMGQFDLGEEVVAAASKGDVEAFAKAMQDSLKNKGDDKKSSDNK